jgi:hypothetical protein
MPNQATSSGIRDNHKRGVVADFLKAKIPSGSRLSVVSAYFMIYAYEALKDRLDQIEHLDFLFGQPKQILEIYRLLCGGKAAAYESLCQLFDNETKNGADMSLYNKLLAATVDSIAKTFQKRVAAGLQTSRVFVIPNQSEQARETTDFQLITWLVIKAP